MCLPSRARSAIIGLLLATAAAGCATSTRVANPSFPVEKPQARQLLAAMHSRPRPLDRPVVVIGGIYDPGFQSRWLAGQIQSLSSSNSTVIHVTCALDGSFDGCARRVIAAIDHAFPSTDSDQTIEVDVVGYSLGGVIARYAASDACAARLGRRLVIHRLFTICSPHRGATLAAIPAVGQRIIDLRAGSEFLRHLNSTPRSYELVAYARLGDLVVGEENTAPPGEVPWWVPRRGLGAHMGAARDPRIVADIGLRLRDESPMTREPAAALP